MQSTFILFLGLAVVLACFIHRAQSGSKPKWAHYLSGWQKLFGLAAILLALLLVLNPEFLALGLFGDTAFFDMFVLALTLQMHAFVGHACEEAVRRLIRGLWRIGIPSPGMCYLLAILTFAIGNTALMFQKLVHRISS